MRAGKAGIAFFQAPVGISVKLAGPDAGNAERAERRRDRSYREGHSTPSEKPSCMSETRIG